MDELAVGQHLREELRQTDPWRLESNPFEQRRLDGLMQAIEGRGPFPRALEVGCAAGVFTQKLARHCRFLEVIDVAPEAIARARRRLEERRDIVWRLADVAAAPLAPASFDLIVAAEVLYYLPSRVALEGAVKNLSQALVPGGLLVFGSAVDEACARWGLIAGAETTMEFFDAQLCEVSRLACHGAYWGENCLIVGYMRDGRL